MSQVWEEWSEAFRNLESEDPRVNQAIELGEQIATERAEQAAERERQEPM